MSYWMVWWQNKIFTSEKWKPDLCEHLRVAETITSTHLYGPILMLICRYQFYGVFISLSFSISAILLIQCNKFSDDSFCLTQTSPFSADSCIFQPFIPFHFLRLFEFSLVLFFSSSSFSMLFAEFQMKASRISNMKSIEKSYRRRNKEHFDKINFNPKW